MKTKILNKYFNLRYIEDVQKNKTTNIFEKNIRAYIKNNNISEKDYVDLVNLILIINDVKNEEKQFAKTSRRFVYFIFRKAFEMDFFAKAKIARENFLIKKMLNLNPKIEVKVFLLRIVIKKYPAYVYNNFEYIKKLLFGFDVINLLESELKLIYLQQYNDYNNKEYIDYSKYFKHEKMQDIIAKEKIYKNKLIDNYNLLDKIISNIYCTPSNFDIKEIMIEKFSFNENDIKNIDNKKINIYAKINIDQKLNISSYNVYSDLIINLRSIKIILNSIFLGYKKIIHDEILRRQLRIYIEEKLRMKYQFVTSGINSYIIIESIESFLYGNYRGVLNIIPLFEKIIRDSVKKDNSKKQVFDFLHEDVFINEWLLFKNIYIKQTNIKKVLSKNKNIMKVYNEEYDFFSLDIRNKFLHGLFVNEDDECLSAIYTYIFINQILDLKLFFNNK